MTRGSGQASGQLSALLLSKLGLVARPSPEPCVSVHSHAEAAAHRRRRIRGIFFPRQLVRGSGGEAVGYLGINGGVNEP